MKLSFSNIYRKNSAMEPAYEALFVLLKSAINDGTWDGIVTFLCENTDEKYLDYVITKSRPNDILMISTSIQQFLPMIPEIQCKISNILNLIIALSEIALFGVEKSLRLTRSLISIAVDSNCSTFYLKQILTMIKSFSQDELTLEQISTDESLIAPLKLIAKRLPEIGDYECQLSLLEMLWQMSSLKRNFYAEWWFDDEQRRDMFLDLYNDEFELGGRRFLNYINGKQNKNRRIVSFIASSVYLGSIRLKEPSGSEFWIDINSDTQSISFYFSSLEIENENTWEIIVISSDMVEDYTIQDSGDNEDRVLELCIALKLSCSQLRESEGISIKGLESNLVRITFESWNEHCTDIPSCIDAIFHSNDEDAPTLPNTKQKRRASQSNDLICLSDHQEETSALRKTKQRRRASESTDLVCLSDYQEEKSALRKTKQRRRASQSTDHLCLSEYQEVAVSQNSKRGHRSSESTELISMCDSEEVALSQKSRQGRKSSESTELVSMFNSENEDVNAIETTDPIPDKERKIRKYSHRKKVFAGFVDSEEINQVEHDANTNKWEDTINSQNIFNTLDSRKKHSAMHDQKSSDLNYRENENYAESTINEIDQVNLPTSILHNKQSVEICSPNKTLQEDNSVEPHINEGYEKNHVEDYSDWKNNIDEHSSTKPKISHNSQMLTVPNITQRKSSQPVENIHPRKKILIEHPQSEPKRSQSLKLITVPDVTQRKSSQSISDVDDTYAISPTPLKNQNNTSFNKLTIKTPKHNKCQSDPTCNLTSFQNGNKPSKSITEVSSRMSLRKHKHINGCKTPVNLSFNDQPKKKRLYNVDQAPVYDVPPSERKSINDSDGNVIISSQKSTSIHNTTNEDNTHHSTRTEENTLHSSPNIHCTGVRNSNVTNDSHLMTRTNQINENNIQHNTRTEENTLCSSPKIHCTGVGNSTVTNDSHLITCKNQINEDNTHHNTRTEENTLCSSPKIHCTGVGNSTVTNDSHLTPENKQADPKLHSPKIVSVTKQVQPNMSQEKIENDSVSLKEKVKDSVIESETEENQFNTEMKCDTNQPPSKRKKVHGRKIEHQFSRDSSVGTSPDVRKASTSNPELHKKKRRRKSAMTARKINKKILEEKGSETSFEVIQQDKQQNKDSGFSQETDEYDVFAISPSMENEMPPYKRKFFESDEDQGNIRSAKKRKPTRKGNKKASKLDEFEFSATPPNVQRRHRPIFITDTETCSSEISWFHKQPKLFETPKKSYSNRKKIKKATDMTKRGKAKMKTSKPISNAKQAFSRRGKASDSETRSKSALSELDNFNLVVEKKASYNPPPPNNLSGLYHTLDYDRNIKQLKINDTIQDYQFPELDVLSDNDRFFEVDGHHDFGPQALENTTANVSLRTSFEAPNVRSKHNSLFQDKDAKSANCSLVNEDSFVSRESTKRKRRKTNSFVEPVSKRNKSFTNIDYSNLDTITGTDEQFQKLKVLHSGSGGKVRKGIEKHQRKSNKSSNDIGKNLPAEETVKRVSLIDIESGYGISKRKTNKNYLEKQTERMLLNCENDLTDESSDDLNDEESGKSKHLAFFLESLSSASPKPQKLGISEKLREENSFSDGCSAVDQSLPYTKLSSENCNMDSKKRKVVNSSSLSKDKHQFVEEFENNFNENAFESPMLTSTPLVHRQPSNDRMSGDDLLMNPSIMHILNDEVDNLTRRLFSTLKRCMIDFRKKMAALRESIVNTAEAMISNESKFTEEDLQTLVRNCRESRIHIQKNLKKLYTLGIEYFEAEKMHERRLAKKHRKAVMKYTKSLLMAKSIAEKALEERFILKSRAFFKTFMKQIKLV